MTQPLALVLYERLLPGTQLVNRLQDLGYRVQVVEDPSALIQTAEITGPLLLFADLESSRANVIEIIAQLRQNASTHHLPVVAFYAEGKQDMEDLTKAAGITLLASESALSNHLPQVLEQALRVD